MELQNGISSPKSALIDQIVNDSIKQNSAPHRPSISSIGKPLRASGRRKKDGSPNRATLKLIASEFEEVKNGPLPPPLGSEQNANGAPPPPGPEPFADDGAMKADDIPDVAIAAVLKAPFDILRVKTGFDGYRLDDETAKGLTPLLKSILEIYLPNVPSKHMPAIVLAGTLGSILYKQYGEHQNFMRTTYVKATVSNAKVPDPAPAVFHPEVRGG
jgi:hypothetical protein